MRRKRVDNGHPSSLSLPVIPGRSPDSSKDPEMIRIISSLPFSTNGYSFEEVIGSGSFGVVFKVCHNGYKREFAAKLIAFKDNQKDEFETEMNMLIRLLHPNIIKIYDSFRYMNKLVMIFQYCPNGTLKSLIQPGSGVSRELVAPFMRQMVSALTYLHGNQIAHLDIKTANVFIDSFMRPLLADFGLSLHMDSYEQISSFAGSIIYRSPEMIQQLPYDPFKADVWALGVTFFLMVTGREPWPMYNIDLMKKSICQGSFELPENIDRDVATVIRRMLTVDPIERPSIIEINELPFIQNQGIVPPKKSTFIRRKNENVKSHLSFNRSLKMKTTSDASFKPPQILTSSTENFSKGKNFIIL